MYDESKRGKRRWKIHIIEQSVRVRTSETRCLVVVVENVTANNIFILL